MATAKRVGQDRKLLKVNNGVDYIKVSEVTEINGVVVHTHVSKSFYAPTVEEVYEDQPDRVVLEMSLEEARHVSKVVGDAPSGVNGVGLDIYAPLMAAVYPREETKAYSGEGGGCAPSVPTYKGEGSSTYR